MWFFESPKIIFGEDSISYVEQIEGKKCFIVTDPGIIKAKLLDLLTDVLKEAGKEWKIFADVESDPKEETILKGAKICQEYDPDLIIALGGGSAIDAAKGIWILYERPELQIDDMHPFIKLGLGTKAKMIAIPTTSGTGAETTWAIVITRIRDGITTKLEQANREAIPTYAIIDPIFTKDLPPKLTAATAFDALAHLLEGLISEWRNDFSDGMSLKAMDLIRTYLVRAYNDGHDMEAREKIHNAATIAGLAFGNSQAIMGHAMGHVLGANFHIHHGMAVGLFLPYILQYSINDPDKNEAKQILSKFSKMQGIALWSDSDDVATQKLVQEIKNMQEQVHMAKSLKELGIKKEEFEDKLELMGNQCLESASATMSPRSATSDVFMRIFQYAYDGKDIDF